MARWQQLEDVAPDLADRVRTVFEGHLHHVMGTLRADGSPRLSGTEVRFHDGDVWLGAMPASRKVADLRRDPRVALHAAPIDVELTANGDAKLDGSVTEVTDVDRMRAFFEAIGHGDDVDPSTAATFVVDIRSTSVVTVAGDHLEITAWSADAGLRTHEVT